VYLLAVALVFLVYVFNKCFNISQGFLGHDKFLSKINKPDTLYYISEVRAKPALDKAGSAI
jgi:hypothetical protein